MQTVLSNGRAIVFGMSCFATVVFSASGAEPNAPQKEKPQETLAAEPLLPKFSSEKATHFLDAGAQAHETTKCISCHGTFAYLMARPALPMHTDKHKKVRVTLEKWVAYMREQGVDKASKPQRRVEAVMSGVILAQHDAATTGKLHPVTRQALDLMWQIQLSDGGFNWLKQYNEPPSAIDNHFGATMAAIGAAVAPDNYAEEALTHARLEKLHNHLRADPPRTMHQRAMLMLADHYVGDLMKEESRQQTIAGLFELQRPDGGWAMGSLGDDSWKRVDRTPRDRTTSDGYGTGFCVYVLRTAGGIPAEDARISRAVAWLKTNQRASGGWYTRAPKNKDSLSSYVGTAYAVLALKACGEIP